MSLENKKQWLNKLKIAIASGHSRVQHGDKSIQYRSLDEIRQIANDYEDAELKSCEVKLLGLVRIYENNFSKKKIMVGYQSYIKKNLKIIT